MNRWLFFLAAASLAVSTLAADPDVYTGQPTNAGQEYLIAGWNFNDAVEAPSSQLAVSHGIGSLATNWSEANMAAFTGTTANAFGNDPAGQDLTLRNGAANVNAGRYLNFTLSLTDFEGLVITYATQRSTSGFTNQEWWWSLDGDDFTHFTTLSAPGSYASQTIDFSSAIAINGASTVHLRLVIDGLPSSPTASGNNRFDNFQFRASASVGSAGPGVATLANATSGSPFEGTEIFSPGEVQSVAINLTGLDSTPIESVAVSLPDGWSDLSVGNVSLSGPGFSGATASGTGNTLTISNAQITDTSAGTLTIHQLTAPSGEEIADFGRSVFFMQTAFAGEALAEMGDHPRGTLVIPISMIRPVDEQGIALALNRKVAVSGVATVGSGVFSVTDFVTYLQDDTAGVAIYYSPAGDIWTDAYEGFRYAAVGIVTQIRGLTQVNLTGNEGFIDLGPDQMPEPKVRTIAQLLTQAEDLEGSLIRIARISKAESSPAWPEPGLNGTLIITDDETNLLPVFLNRFTDVSVYPEPDYPVDLVGIFSQHGSTSAPFDTGYQLIPRAYSDIHPASEIEKGFEQWQRESFTDEDLADSSVSGPEADPDGDDVSNLLEYALGGNPWESSRHFLPQTSISDGDLEITFRRVKVANDLIYEVEVSPDLVDWVAIWSSEDFPYTDPEPVIEERVADPAPLEGTISRFLRLVVTRQEP